jgi:serine/threonine protein kinase
MPGKSTQRNRPMKLDFYLVIIKFMPPDKLIRGGFLLKIKWPGKVLLERRGALVTQIKMNGAKIVLKASLGRDPLSKYLIDAETVALEVLKGLAVPKRISFSRKNATEILKTNHFYHIATEWIPYQSSYGKKFSATQALGLWLFALEQLCAFHCRKIIYTDLKSDHIYVSEDFLEARFIDFDSCIMVESKGVYPTRAFRYTAALSAPELYLYKCHGENVLVYQAGMLLGSFLMGEFSNPDINNELLLMIKTKFKKIHCEGIFKVFESCISRTPKKRPQNLESLFKLIKNLNLPSETYEIWAKLRSPYEKELSKLGLRGLQNQKIGKKAA